MAAKLSDSRHTHGRGRPKKADLSHAPSSSVPTPVGRRFEPRPPGRGSIFAGRIMRYNIVGGPGVGRHKCSLSQGGRRESMDCKMLFYRRLCIRIPRPVELARKLLKSMSCVSVSPPAHTRADDDGVFSSMVARSMQAVRPVRRSAASLLCGHDAEVASGLRPVASAAAIDRRRSALAPCVALHSWMKCVLHRAVRWHWTVGEACSPPAGSAGELAVRREPRPVLTVRADADSMAASSHRLRGGAGIWVWCAGPNNRCDGN